MTEPRQLDIPGTEPPKPDVPETTQAPSDAGTPSPNSATESSRNTTATRAPKAPAPTRGAEGSGPTPPQGSASKRSAGAPKAARDKDNQRIPDPDKPGSYLRWDDPRAAALGAVGGPVEPEKPAPPAREKRPPRVDASPPAKPLSEPVAPDPIAEGRRRIAANAPYCEGIFAQTTTPLIHLAAAVYAGVDLEREKVSYGLTRFKPDNSGTVEIHPLRDVPATAVLSRAQGEITAYYAEGLVPDHPLMNAGIGLGNIAAMIGLRALMKYGFIPRPAAADKRNPPEEPTPAPVRAEATIVQ